MLFVLRHNWELVYYGIWVDISIWKSNHCVIFFGDGGTLVVHFQKSSCRTWKPTAYTEGGALFQKTEYADLRFLEYGWNCLMYGSSNADDSQSHKYIHSSNNFNDRRRRSWKKKCLGFWQKWQGMLQRERMEEHLNLECISRRSLQKNSKSRMTRGERRSEEI